MAVSRSRAAEGLVLGALSIVGSAGITAYVPAFAAMGGALSVGLTGLQVSVVAYFLSIAICQLACGPLSDAWGRRPVLLAGLAVYAVGAAGCALSWSFAGFLAFRILQGIGACAPMILPRAIVTDRHAGKDAAPPMAVIMAVLCLSPILAPLAGRLVQQAAGWRAILWLEAGLGLAGFALAALGIRETRPAPQDRPTLPEILRRYRSLLLKGRFHSLVVIGSLGMAILMSFGRYSATTFIGRYGLPVDAYSLEFVVNAAVFGAGAFLMGLLALWIGLARTMRGAVIGLAAANLVLLGLFLTGLGGLLPMALFTLVTYGLLGIIFPASATLAMQQQAEVAGAASALLGTLQMVVAAGVMALLAAFAGDSHLRLMAGFTLCTVAVTLIALCTIPRA
jgi:DHA1 family bicyclomycin/chloramphenicol resistance-like MFS transporter